MSAVRRSTVMLSSALLLAACSGEQQELQGWMDQQRREVKPSVTPLAAPTKFEPQAYLVLDQVEPFSAQKLSVALRQEMRQTSALLTSEANRRKQPLEAYPLDTITMVGSVVRGGQSYALLRVDNLLHQVRVGEYLGPNFGKITRITETDITLREIVQDAAGEWIERPATLTLQERAK